MSGGSLALALHDFLPVLAAAGGFAYLVASVGARYRAASPVAAVGSTLVVAAGATKAAAKLLDALSAEAGLVFLDEALFPLLAPGMVLVAAAVGAALDSADRRRRLRTLLPVVPLSLWGLAGGSTLWIGKGAAVGLLIGVATVANVVLAVRLIRWSKASSLPNAAVLFAANLVVVLVLAGLARLVEQTTAWQWIEQNVNLLGQVAFLVAARLLHRAVVLDRESLENARS